MKLANLPQPQHDWPQSWVEANRYDREESEDSVEVTPYGDLYRLRTKLLLDLLQRYVSVGRAIIDIAAAQGSFTEKFAGLGYRVTWNDIRPELSQYVALKTKGLTITYMPGNIFEIDPVLFDAAVACEIIEHVAHPDQFLKRVAQFITPGGHLVLSTPNGEYFRHTGPVFSDYSDRSQFEKAQFAPNADGHIFLLTRRELVELSLAAGLEVVSVELFGNTLLAGHCGLRFVQKLVGSRAGALAEWLLRYLPDSLRRRVLSGIVLVARKPGGV